MTDVAGGQTEIEVAQVVDALPAATDHGVLVSLPALARTSGELDTTRTQRQIWLGDASPATIERTAPTWSCSAPEATVWAKG